MRTDTSKLFWLLAIVTFIITVPPLIHKPKPQVVLQPIAVHVKIKPEPVTIESESLIDKQELECLAQNVYHEARGESIDGMIAVAHVTINRVESKRFPDSICGVVKQAKYSKWWKEAKGKLVPVRNKCQFSWYCDGKSDEIKDQRSWEHSMLIALKVMTGQTSDLTGGAIYYYNPDKASPYWKDHYTQVAMVDNHVFLK